MNRISLFACAFAYTAANIAFQAEARAHDWPIEPADADHPLGNTLGEFWSVKGSNPLTTFQHAGIDILATSYPEDSAAPWVVVTVGGKIRSWYENQYGVYGFAEIAGTDGNFYHYGHLAYESFDPEFRSKANVQGVVSAGTRIARITSYGCGYDHLHYAEYQYNSRRSGVTRYLNPMTNTAPRPDPDSPEILQVEFASHGAVPGTKFSAVGADGVSTIVNGEVDVIARIKDRDGAGSSQIGASNVGVQNLRWRVCPSNTPNCANWNETHAYDDMPGDWAREGNPATALHFSTSEPWVSGSDECSVQGNNTFVVLSSYPAASPNSNGSWKTTAYQNGLYLLTVEASDLAGNIVTNVTSACVRNPTSSRRPCPPSSLSTDGSDPETTSCGPPC